LAAPGHGDHWLAALAPDDPRLRDALSTPVDAPAGLHLYREPLNEALDQVRVTRDRRLVTAYPEPRATTLVRATPRALELWETRAEAWLTVEHPGAGALTLFVTDLAESAPRYAAAGTRRGVEVELGAIAYAIARAAPYASPGPARLQPAARTDARFLPDDHRFDAEVLDVRPAGDGEVLDLAFHGGLAFPVAWRERSGVEPGSRVSGYLWLTGRMPEGPTSKGV
jgi:hypothetical protein